MHDQIRQSPENKVQVRGGVKSEFIPIAAAPATCARSRDDFTRTVPTPSGNNGSRECMTRVMRCSESRLQAARLAQERPHERNPVHSRSRTPHRPERFNQTYGRTISQKDNQG